MSPTPTAAGIEQRKAILREILSSMVYHPERLDVHFFDVNPTTLVKIVAHPHDVNILVGFRGQVIDGIAKLARLLWAGVNPVEVMDIESDNGEREKHNEQFVPKKDWQEQKLIGLMTRIGKMIFPESVLTVESKSQGRDEQWFMVRLDPMPARRECDDFSAAVNKTFLPIGKKAGKKIYAGVRR